MKRRIKIAVLLIAFLGFLILLVTVISKRRSEYEFDTKQSYVYEFNQKEVLQTEIKNGKFVLPNSINTDNSVFLEVDISTTLLGNYFQPSIHITAKNNKFIQFLELGAKGTRYLNLSSIVEKGIRSIELTGVRSNIADQKANLIIYNNLDLSNSKILVVAPHPDDAEIAAYGVYSKYPKSFVLTVASGDAGAFNYDEIYLDSSEHYMAKAKLRTWNSVTVPLLGGISKDSLLNLGFFDGTLQKMYETRPKNVHPLYAKSLNRKSYENLNFSSLSPCSFGTSNWNSLVENIKCVLKNVKPNIIITPHPDIDTHSDHKYTSIAVLQALKELEIRDGSLFFYTNHFTNDLYPFGSLGSVVSLPPSFDDSIYFNSIYSNNLDSMLQREKVFALEAMNDLRMDTEFRFPSSLLKESGLLLSRKILGKEKDYYRRAVRSNELFFVVPISEIYNTKNIENLVATNIDIHF